jgi:hypothetical protein
MRMEHYLKTGQNKQELGKLKTIIYFFVGKVNFMRNKL